MNAVKESVAAMDDGVKYKSAEGVETAPLSTAPSTMELQPSFLELQARQRSWSSRMSKLLFRKHAAKQVMQIHRFAGGSSN